MASSKTRRAPGAHAYDFVRRADVFEPTFVIDMATATLLDDVLPMQSWRAAGLQTLIGSIGPLARLAIRVGMAPSWRTEPTDYLDLAEALPARPWKGQSHR